MKKHTFILSDNTVNESGFRIATAGIDLDKFRANPVMLYMHQRAGWSDPKAMPIGKWENIRVEDGKVLAEADFDQEDEFAMKVKSKVDRGYINAASISVRVTSVSVEAVDLLEGQTRPTIIESVAKEASIVDIPRNANCLTLTDDEGNYIDLNSQRGQDELNNILPIINTKNKEDMKSVIVSLGLPEGSTEAAILAAIQNEKNNVKNLSDKVAELEQQIKDSEEQAKKDKADALVQSAIDAKRITESDRGNWLALAEGNYESTKKALENIQPYTSLASQIETGGNPDKSKNLEDADLFEAKWKDDKLKEWQQENPEEYARCYAAYHAE